MFGNIFSQKKRAISKLKRIQETLERKSTFKLRAREAEIRLEIENILNQKEMLWFQKSRNEWLTQEDKSTSYFHRHTLKKRSQNRTIGLQIVDLG